jgi:hypothetical protein
MLRWSGVNLRPAVPARAAGTPPRRGRRVPWLAALGLVLVVALGGCTIPGFPAAQSGKSSGSDDDAAAEPGSSWFWYQEGDPVAPESTRAAWPAASTTTTAPAATPAPTASSTPECQTRLASITRKLRATGGAGQGTLFWSHIDDPRVVEYRVAAVVQEHPGGDDLPAQAWTTVAKPTAGCQEMTATVTGLISGRHYVFWLDAVITAQPDGFKEPMIGRSNAVLVT